MKVLCRDFVSSSETKFDEVYNLNSVYPISNENWQYYTQLTMISQIISNQTKCLNFKKSTILREIMREHIWTYYLLFDTFPSICLKNQFLNWSWHATKKIDRKKNTDTNDGTNSVLNLISNLRSCWLIQQKIPKNHLDVFETMLNLISNLYTVKIIKTNFKTNTIVSCRICKYPDGNYSGLQ